MYFLNVENISTRIASGGVMITNNTVSASMKIRLSDELPEETVFEAGIRRAPDRGFRLTRRRLQLR